MPEEYTRICERPTKSISQGQPQQCQYESPPPNQQNSLQYGYNHQQVHPNMMANTINQQPHFPDGLQNGDLNNPIRRGKVPGSNLQAVDMDVNEILKVIIYVVIINYKILISRIIVLQNPIYIIQ